MLLIYKIINIFFSLKLYKITNILNIALSYIDKEKNKNFYKYKFYLRKNKIYENNFLEEIYPPKIFLIKNLPINKIIFKKIKSYKIKNPKNEYDNKGHTNIYQSLHDLNNNKIFEEETNYISKIVNEKILPMYNLKNSKAKVEKLWFTITKQSGVMKKHHHLDGELSGVLYLQSDASVKNPGFINLYNSDENFILYEASSLNESFTRKRINNKIFKFKPSSGDLIIFDSYIDHAVKNGEDIILERISMPWDASLHKIS